MDDLTFLAGDQIEHAVTGNVSAAPRRIGLPRVAQSLYDSLALCLTRLF
jgi:hypothetical protein